MDDGCREGGVGGGFTPDVGGGGGGEGEGWGGESERGGGLWREVSMVDVVE